MKGGGKMKKIAIILIICILFSFGTSITASAEEYDILPRYANANICERSFYIQNDNAIAYVKVVGISNVTSFITVNIILEKRALLGLWWKEEASWHSSTTDVTKTFEFTQSIGKGTYRCNFEVIIEGNGGSADVITDQITVSN